MRPLRQTRRKLLSLAMTSALTAFMPNNSPAQTTTISSDYQSPTGHHWNSNDLYISNGVTMAATDTVAAAVWVANGRFGTLTNDGGTLQGGGVGLRNFNGATIDIINNNGVIRGGNIGVANNRSYIGTLNNSGSILGAIGVELSSYGTIGTLNNRGLIGGSQMAISVDSAAGLTNFINSGTIAGNISYSPTSELAISGGTGTSFGILTGASGNLGAADIGWLKAAGKVRFVSGNQLLNDHIDVGNSRVINDAANLQINQHITIAGNYEQAATAALLIGVADGAQAYGNAVSDSGYGQLVVNGHATLAAGSTVALASLNSYAFAAGQRFVVIQADTADYHADSLKYGASGFDGVVNGSSVERDGKQALVLRLGNGGGNDGGNGDSGIHNAADNRHAWTVLDALYRYDGYNSNVLRMYNPALALDSTDAANRAGEQLTPVAVTAASSRAARSTFQGVFRATAEHIDQRRSGGNASGIASGESARQSAIWSKAFGGRITQSEHDQSAGYHGNFRGMLIGGDTLVSSDLRAGAVLSYATTSMANDGSNTGSSVKVKSYGMSGYASYDAHPAYLTMMMGAARQQFSTVRMIDFAGFAEQPAGSFNGMQYLMSLQAGYPLEMKMGRLTPLVGLSYSSLRQNAYTERGSAAALAIQAASSTSLKSDLGIRLERTLATNQGDVTPSLQLGWRHELHDSRLRSDASFVADTSNVTDFSTTGVAPIKDTAVLGLGLMLARSRNLSVAANYTVETARGYTAQSGDVRLRWQY
jgi:outer membrane autotransporter protein